MYETDEASQFEIGSESENHMEINSEITSLAKEVMEDAELGRLSAEALVLKATRLARLVKNENMSTWLALERMGYFDKEPDVAWMKYTGRPLDETTRIGYWGSIAVQEAAIEADAAEMEVVKNFKPSGEWSAMQLYNQQQQTRKLANSIATYKRIRSRVTAVIQEFASNVYYEKLLSQKAGDIFTQYSEAIDTLLADQVGEVLSMLPSVFERLNSSDGEAVNQALLSCRRILDAAINKLYPPSDIPIKLNEEELVVNAEKTKNRFKAYISQRTASRSVQEKLIGNIRTLYDRTSTAVHKDVTKEEAKALVLQLYITLGEILTLGEVPPPTQPLDNPSENGAAGG